MTKKLQECFLTVVLPLTRSSFSSFRVSGTTTSGFSNVFCSSAPFPQRCTLRISGRRGTYTSTKIIRVHLVHLYRGDFVPVESEIETPIGSWMSIEHTESDTVLIRSDHRYEIDIGRLETGVLDPYGECGTGTTVVREVLGQFAGFERTSALPHWGG